MPTSKPEPEPQRCACGRQRAAAAANSYRSHNGRFVFHRCDCGAEWTDRLEAPDPAEPVTSDEVLEVHERLAHFEGQLAELLGLKPAS